MVSASNVFSPLRTWILIVRLKDLHLLRNSRREPNLPVLFHLNPFLQDCPKDLHKLPSRMHAEAVHNPLQLPSWLKWTAFRLGCNGLQKHAMSPIMELSFQHFCIKQRLARLVLSTQP